MGTDDKPEPMEVSTPDNEIEVVMFKRVGSSVRVVARFKPGPTDLSSGAVNFPVS